MPIDYHFRRPNEAGRVFSELKAYYRGQNETELLGQLKYRGKTHILIPEGAVSKLEEIAGKIKAKYEKR